LPIPERESWLSTLSVFLIVPFDLWGTKGERFMFMCIKQKTPEDLDFQGSLLPGYICQDVLNSLQR